MSKRNLSKPGKYSFTKFYTHDSSVGLLSSPGWPSFTSRAGTVVAAKNPIYQQQSFNGFLEALYEKFNNEHLEILEGFNDTETEQILVCIFYCCYYYFIFLFIYLFFI